MVGAFVLHGAGRVPALEPVVGGLEIGAVARLVAETPDDDGRVVEVPLRHALRALHMGLGISGVLRQRLRAIAHAVRLDVRLVDDIQAIAVAEIQPDILQHLLHRDHVPARGRELVAVGALDQDRPAVDQQLPARDLHFAEAEIQLRRLRHALLVRADGSQVVERRRLRAPQVRALHAAGGGHLHFRESRSGEIEFHTFGGLGQGGVEAEAAVHPGADVQVLDAGLRPRRQESLPGDARETPEILVLQVGPVAPAEDLQGDEGVLAGLDEFRDVETRLQLAVLAVTHFLAVHPHADVGGGAAYGEEDITPRPVGGNRHAAAVLSDVVVLGRDDGRIVREMPVPGVRDVGVEGIAVAIQLPHPGHGDRVPGGVVHAGLEEVRRTGAGRLIPAELPDAVE